MIQIKWILGRITEVREKWKLKEDADVALLQY